jgi:oxygen-independent coproporphyrinogen-3 oxidase
VGEREALEESVFLGLRMCEGVSVSELRREFAVDCEDAVRDLVAEGLMAVEGERWKLTMRGRLVSNEVFGRVLEETGIRA